MEKEKIPDIICVNTYSNDKISLELAKDDMEDIIKRWLKCK